MLILLSPAKTLDLEAPLRSSLAAHLTQPRLLDQSAPLAAQLAALAPHELAELMRLSDALAQLNANRYTEWQVAHAWPEARPALLTFAGDVYDGLAASSLADPGWTYAQRHLRLLSGLYGVLRPLDLMRPYRLEMGTRLANPRGRDLYAYWGGRITALINQDLAQTPAAAVVNLASVEYFRSVRVAELAAPVVTPVFEDWKNGQFKVISFYAKRARGALARFAIDQQLTDPQDLQAFRGDGYCYTPEVSGPACWVFRRRQD